MTKPWLRIHGGPELEHANDGFVLPVAKGRLLLEPPGWFHAQS